MTARTVLWRVDCQAGCGLVSAFTVQLEQSDKRRLEERILATAGWLRVADEWTCPGCSHVLRERIGTLSSKHERQVFDAIRDALRQRRMEVVP